MWSVAAVAGVRFDVFRFAEPALAAQWLNQNILTGAVVVDDAVPGAIALLKYARSAHPLARRVLLTRFDDLQQIVAGLHDGTIHTCVEKPPREAALLASLLPPQPRTNGRPSAAGALGCPATPASATRLTA